MDGNSDGDSGDEDDENGDEGQDQEDEGVATPWVGWTNSFSILTIGVARTETSVQGV